MAVGAVRIDERLYLKLPIDREDGQTIWVHAQAISLDTFERYWFPLSKTFATIYEEGLGVLAGPRTALRMLKRVSERSGDWDGVGGVQLGLLPEIRRLANVLVPEQGWQVYPFEEAVKKQLLDPDDAREIESLLVFFTVAWHLHRRAERQAVMGVVLSRLDASMSSATLSELLNSLRTSSATGNTGETVPIPSLPPSSIGAPASGLSNASGTGPTNSLTAPHMSSASGTSYAG